jgi:hypothetical protein
MPVTAGQIMDAAAALVNDVNKVTYTYVKQLPYLRLAYQEIQDRMVLVASPNINTVSAPISVVAGTASIDTIGATSSRDLLLEPVTVLQRAVGANNDAWEPVERMEWIGDLEEPGATIGGWSWREGLIKLIPATANREIKILYRQRLAVIANETTEVLFPAFNTFLSQKTAHYLADFVMKDKSRAATLYALSEKAFETALMTSTKALQHFAVKRRSYFFKR